AQPNATTDNIEFNFSFAVSAYLPSLLKSRKKLASGLMIQLVVANNRYAPSTTIPNIPAPCSSLPEAEKMTLTAIYIPIGMIQRAFFPLLLIQKLYCKSHL